MSSLDLRPKIMRSGASATALGVDPGFANCGFAVVTETLEGVIKAVHVEAVITERADEEEDVRVADDDGRRLTQIQKATVRLLHEFNPKLIGIETYVPLAGKGANGAFKVATVYGLIHGLATSANRPVFGFAPTDLRRALLGQSAGSKKDIADAVLRICPSAKKLLDAKPKKEQEHLIDALAHAIVALDHTRTTRRLIAQRRGR